MSGAELRSRPDRAIFGPGRHADYSIAARTDGWSDQEAERAAGILRGLNFNISLTGGLALVEDTEDWHLFFRYQTAQKRDSVGRQYLLEEVTRLSRDEFLRIRCNPFRLQFPPLVEPSESRLEPPGLPITTVDDDRTRLEHLLRSSAVRFSRVEAALAALIDAERIVMAESLADEEMELLFLLLPVPLRARLTFQSPIHEPAESRHVPRLLVVPRGALDGYGALIVDIENRRGAQAVTRTVSQELLRMANDSARWTAFLEDWAEVAPLADSFGTAVAGVVREARLRDAEERYDPVAFLDLVSSAPSPSPTAIERFLRRFRPEAAASVLKAALDEANRDRIRILAVVLERVYRDPLKAPMEDALRDGLWSMRDRWTGSRPTGDRSMQPFLLVEALRRDAPSEAVQLTLGSPDQASLPGRPDLLPERMKHLGQLLYATEPPRPDATLSALAATPGWPENPDARRAVAEWTARLFLGNTANQGPEAAMEFLEPCEAVWAAISKNQHGVLTLAQDEGTVLSFLGVGFAPRAGWLQEPSSASLVDGVASLLELDEGSGYARPREAVVLAWLLLRRVRNGYVGEGAIGAAVALVRRVESRRFEISSLRERLLQDPGIATLLVRSGIPLHEAGADFRHDVFVQALCLEIEKMTKAGGDGAAVVVFCGWMAREGVYLRESDFRKAAGSTLPDTLAQMFSAFARAKDATGKLRWIYLNLAFVTEPAAMDALRAGFAEAVGDAVGPVELWLLSRSLAEVNRARTLAAYDRLHALHERAIEERVDLTGADAEALEAFTRLPKRPSLRVPFRRRGQSQ